jgi:hypothetical protein
MNNMWFKELMGFDESPERIYTDITIKTGMMQSAANGKSYRYGLLETASLYDLRNRVSHIGKTKQHLTFREISADAQDLHMDPINELSLFQVASQFNLLEMSSHRVTPEYGVDIYANDRTQGPACAISAGAGTIYRNYFAQVNGKTGQSEHNQINCISELGIFLGNTNSSLWKMKNGYLLPSEEGLGMISEKIAALNCEDRDKLKSLLRIGLQWNTQVTVGHCNHMVSQAYCSALPIAYSTLSESLWEPFARLVLEAAYEATVCAGLINSHLYGNNKIFLTQLGGGAFGNKISWILSAIQISLEKYINTALDVYIVTRGFPNKKIAELVDAFG